MGEHGGINPNYFESNIFILHFFDLVECFTQLANMIVLWKPRIRCKFIPMQTRIYCPKTHKSIVFYKRYIYFVEKKFFSSLTFSIIASWKFGNLETLAQLKQINL